MIGFLHALRHNMGCSSMRTRMARMARDGLDRGEGCEQGSLEVQELAVNRERENHASVKAGCHCHCCFRAQPGRLLFLIFHTKIRGPRRSSASSSLAAEASQVCCCHIHGHHLEKNKVCIVFPRKNIMQPAESRSCTRVAAFTHARCAGNAHPAVQFIKLSWPAAYLLGAPARACAQR